MSAFLVLEDGTVFRGESVGAPGSAFGEAVFTTAMTGYQEVVTDPSYCGQIVLLHRADGRQLRRRRAPQRVDRGRTRGAVVMREARGPEWTDWLRDTASRRSPASTRASLVLHLRERGAMRAAVVTGSDDVDEALRAVREQPSMNGAALAGRVSTRDALRPQRGRRGAGRGRRLRREALDPAPARRRGRVGDRLPARRRRGHARRVRRRAALERPRRPRAARRRGRCRRASCSAACRCSASASATSCSRSRPACARSSSRSATAARTTPSSSARPAACS